MNPDSEVTADVITKKDRKDRLLLRETHIYKNLPDGVRTAFGAGEVIGSVGRAGRAYVLIKLGTSLLAIPDLTLTKLVGGGLVLYGAAEGAFATSNAVEGIQETYYGYTNQKDKESISPGKILLGEDEYIIFDSMSASAETQALQIADYTKVMSEGKSAQKVLEKNTKDYSNKISYNNLNLVNEEKNNIVLQNISPIKNNKKVGDLISYAEENGAEVYYRTMSKKDYEIFKSTGKIPATGETFISPTQSYSEKYEGVLVKFKVKQGTTDKLIDIGVRDNSREMSKEFSTMEKSSKGWNKNNAYFKQEPLLREENINQVNIGLGKGEALDTFNRNIVESEVIKIIDKKEINKK